MKKFIQKLKENRRLISIGFILLAGLIGYQYPLSYDASFNKNNTLHHTNLEFLSTLDKPLTLELFTRDPNVKEKVQNLVSLFQRETPFLQLKMANSPISYTEKSILGLQTEHHLLLKYQDQIKAVDLNMAKWNEELLSNLIFQTLRNKSQWIVFLSGHGEPDPMGSEKHEMNQLIAALKNKGLQTATLNIAEQRIIPDNTETLVINATKTPLLPYETQTILEYIARGGNLLWLMSPDTPYDPSIAKALGIEWLDGILQDFQAIRLGAPNPEISVITQYPDHPITRVLDLLTVFPYSRPFNTKQATDLGWEASTFLMTHHDTVLQNQKEKSNGPFILGASLTKGKQRIVVMGNNHFLSNAGIHNYGNMMLANYLFNWLNEADLPLNITYQPPMDALFTQNAQTQILFQYLFPICLPLAFFLMGWGIKRNRYKRSCSV